MNRKHYGMPVWGTVTTENPVVKTTHGWVAGFARDGIAIFKGIPYGGSCSGERRFLPPVPADPWEGIRDCTKAGPVAMQVSAEIESRAELAAVAAEMALHFAGGHLEYFMDGPEVQSEDCLVLNVFTPGIDEKKRPVLVYIHGGGFGGGSGRAPFGCDLLVKEEDIVVVSLNHRLNIFGFLSLGAFDSRYAESGNAGLLDLVLALQWVKENVAAFGGDPDRVTLMGESGGGMKISHLLAMECAQGLFHRAIVESGSHTVGDLSTATATQRAQEVLEKLGIGEGELEKLADVPAETLLAIVKEMELREPVFGFSPVADDVVIPRNKGRGFYAPKGSADIPLLVGASEDESALTMALLPQSEIDSLEHLKDWLISSRDRIWGAGGYLTEENTEKVIQVFQQASRKEKSLWHLGVYIVSQISFLGRGAYFQAEAKAKQNAAPVYQYLVAYDTATFVLPNEKASWHTADLVLQFRQVYNPEHEALSRAMAHAWAAFARTGNPSTDEVAWEPFTLETRQIMVFDEQGARMETDPLQLPREVITEIIEARENNG